MPGLGQPGQQLLARHGVRHPALVRLEVVRNAGLALTSRVATLLLSALAAFLLAYAGLAASSYQKAQAPNPCCRSFASNLPSQVLPRSRAAANAEATPRPDDERPTAPDTTLVGTTFDAVATTVPSVFALSGNEPVVWAARSGVIRGPTLGSAAVVVAAETETATTAGEPAGVGPGAASVHDPAFAGSDVSRLESGLGNNTFFHYTDLSGYEGITESSRFVAGPSGNVFFTQDMLSSEETFTHLFAGNPAYAENGEYMIAVQQPEGALFSPGTQANEFIHAGSLNFSPEDLLFAGPNPFG